MSNALTIRGLSLRIGGLQALSEVDLDLPDGTAVGLIGPNGAGKTSLINCVTGIYRYQSGTVKLGDVSLTGMSSSAIARAGVSRTFQQTHLVPGLVVEDNLLLARDGYFKRGHVWNAIRFGPGQSEEKHHRREVRNLLDRLGIGDWCQRPVDTLTLWEQKQVAVARALAAEAHVILLDEPAAGLSAPEKERLIAVLKRAREEFGAAQLVIEHDLGFVNALCSDAAVLVAGRNMANGTPQAVMADPAVADAYLGTSVTSLGPETVADSDARDA